MDRSLDCQEQYFRRESLLIHGAKKKRENIDEVITGILENEMKEKISVNEINRSHHLGKKHTESRPLPIILTFLGALSAMQCLNKKNF